MKLTSLGRKVVLSAVALMLVFVLVAANIVGSQIIGKAKLRAELAQQYPLDIDYAKLINSFQPPEYVQVPAQECYGCTETNISRLKNG